jgi:nucleotide-binding universal stress UspA family protein
VTVAASLSRSSYTHLTPEALEESMDTKVGRRPVVVGYDMFGAGDAAFDWAVHEAERRDAPLHMFVARGVLYNAAPGFGAATPWPADLTGQLVAEARSYAASRAPDATVTIDSALGSPASSLVEASKKADLVVVGRRHHTAVGEAIAGSTSTQVVAHAACPVVVVDREFDCPSTAPIVVAVDGSPANDAALAFAFDRASALSAPLVALHAWWLEVPDRVGISWLSEDKLTSIGDAHERLLEEAVAGWTSKYPDVDVRKVLVRALPVEALVAEAEGAQLIVVGSRGHGGFAGLLLGSVSQGLLHHDRPCPLAVVHSQE